jgi:hypothetical protein
MQAISKPELLTSNNSFAPVLLQKGALLCIHKSLNKAVDKTQRHGLTEEELTY